MPEIEKARPANQADGVGYGHCSCEVKREGNVHLEFFHDGQWTVSVCISAAVILALVERIDG